jgi:hypothetical protein
LSEKRDIEIPKALRLLPQKRDRDSLAQLERFPHDLTRQGFPSRRRCDSAFLLVAGGQHGWHERYHRIFGTELSQRLMVG